MGGWYAGRNSLRTRDAQRRQNSDDLRHEHESDRTRLDKDIELRLEATEKLRREIGETPLAARLRAKGLIA